MESTFPLVGGSLVILQIANFYYQPVWAIYHVLVETTTTPEMESDYNFPLANLNVENEQEMIGLECVAPYPIGFYTNMEHSNQKVHQQIKKNAGISFDNEEKVYRIKTHVDSFLGLEVACKRLDGRKGLLKEVVFIANNMADEDNGFSNNCTKYNFFANQEDGQDRKLFSAWKLLFWVLFFTFLVLLFFSVGFGAGWWINLLCDRE